MGIHISHISIQSEHLRKTKAKNMKWTSIILVAAFLVAMFSTTFALTLNDCAVDSDCPAGECCFKNGDTGHYECTDHKPICDPHLWPGSSNIIELSHKEHKGVTT